MWCRGCVPPETVAWLTQQSADLPPVPSLAVVHIPMPQFMAAWSGGAANGSRSELVSCPSSDSGLFAALQGSNISMVLSGHDHDNNFCALHGGIRLAYGYAYLCAQNPAYPFIRWRANILLAVKCTASLGIYEGTSSRIFRATK